MQRRDFLTGLAAATAAPLMAQERQPRTSAIVNGAFRGLLVRPARPNGAGVLLQPTIAAINRYMRASATQLADLGYTVLIWDPYGGDIAPADTAAQLARSKRIRDEDAMRELRLGVDHLARRLKLRSVATIGWCLGGRFALLHAGLDDRVAAVIAYNPTIYARDPVALYGIPTSRADFPGQTLPEFELAARIGCPVQVFRPGHDLAQPAEYERLADALSKRPAAATQFAYFPQADHGFSYQVTRPENRAAAKLAWPIALAMLEATRA